MVLQRPSNQICEGGSPGLVVMEETHVMKVMGSNPGAIYWMDMTFSH